MIFILSNINFIANFVILSFLVIISIAVLRSKNLVTSTILLSIFSMLMALEYLILKAPDVAITEATVGAGISTIFLMLGIFLTGEKEKRIKGNLFAVILVIAVAALLIYASHGLPIFGANDTPAQKHISSYFLLNSMQDTGVQNVVTSVLASYRGYDTFGEVIVIFAAGIAVAMLLGKISVKKKKA